MGQQPPAARHQRAQQLELGRREVHLLAVAAHRGRPGRARGRPRAARARRRRRAARGAAPRAAGRSARRAERLGHVVVGAGLQRAHLLVLLPHRRQHDDRRLAPLADRAAELDAVAVGEDEVDDRRVGRVQRGGVEGLGRGCAASDSKPASRSMTRSARRICGSSSQTRTRGATAGRARAGSRRGAPGGSWIDEARALAGQRLGPDRARRWPRGNRARWPGPRPEPRAPALVALR